MEISGNSCSSLPEMGKAEKQRKGANMRRKSDGQVVSEIKKPAPKCKVSLSGS